jgi:uncharacterized damage-inducible protein DinB
MPELHPTTVQSSRFLQLALEQSCALAETLPSETYALPIAPVASSIGAHLRHTLDFVQAFLRGFEAGRIDYDARVRDERLERDPARAVEVLRTLVARLDALPAGAHGRALVVRHEAGPAPAPDEGWHRSSVARELDFLASHTVHHLALVALALRLAGLDPGPELGVAPSTLIHWRERACSSPSPSRRS